MNILALDIATKTGWATKNGSGVWDLTTKRDESQGMKLIRFKAKLNELLTLEPIELVVFERSAGKFKSSIITQSELHGVLKLFLEENKIDYRAYSAKEIKKFATGNGNAGKPKMMKAAEEKFPNIDLVDDNHADALWILALAEEDLKHV